MAKQSRDEEINISAETSKQKPRIDESFIEQGYSQSKAPSNLNPLARSQVHGPYPPSQQTYSAKTEPQWSSLPPIVPERPSSSGALQPTGVPAATHASFELSGLNYRHPKPSPEDKHEYISGEEAIWRAEMEQYFNNYSSLRGEVMEPADGAGQHPTPAGNAKVSTIAWPEESTLCILVEADGTSIARRCDNNMINGTKLLNFAKMSRGRRDGLLKQEKARHVVRIGSQHFKGVWIPYERALDIARSTNVVDELFPLFLAKLENFLYSESNITRTKQIVRAAQQKNPVFRHWQDGIPNLYRGDQERRQQQQFQLAQFYGRHPPQQYYAHPYQFPPGEFPQAAEGYSGYIPSQQYETPAVPQQPVTRLDEPRRPDTQGVHRRGYSFSRTLKTPYARPPSSAQQPAPAPQSSQESRQARPYYYEGYEYPEYPPGQQPYTDRRFHQGQPRPPFRHPEQEQPKKEGPDQT